MIKLNNPAIWQPNYITESVLALDATELRRTGITHLVFDLDNTLVVRRTNTLAPDYIRQIAALKQAGFEVLIGSNTRRDIRDITEALDVFAVPTTLLSIKPFKSFYYRVIVAAGTTPQHIAMVGDTILNDVIGANRAGLTSILVTSFHPRTSLLYRRYIQRALRHSDEGHR